MKKIVFNTWPGAFFHPGGGEVQLLNSKKELEKLGYDIQFYDNWAPQFEKGMIYHQFSIEPGTESVMYAYKEKGVKIALSPIMWNLFDEHHPRFSVVKNMLEWADILMTNSKAESNRLAKHFNIPIYKFHETRNGVSDEYLSSETLRDFRKEFGLPPEFVLSVANIDNRKNTERLVKACAKLNLDLVLVGAVREVRYFDKFKDLYPKVRFIGSVTDTGLLKSAYQQCIVFALPSLCETPGISAMEAMSQGAKVVITGVGATKEYFQDCATYVEPLSIDSICEGISIELKMNRGHDCRDHILERFIWTHAAKDIHKGYLCLS